MAVEPLEYPVDQAPQLIEENQDAPWTPLYYHECSFSPDTFRSVMLNHIRNPNVNSSHLFRADILSDVKFTEKFQASNYPASKTSQFHGFDLKTVMVRRLIPRNLLLDKTLDQTCLMYEKHAVGGIESLVVYLPHVSSAEELPFYHPNVRAIAFLHSFDTETKSGVVSVHFSFFASVPQTLALQRVGFRLLYTVQKHGQGCQAGYVKRVNHDVVLPQASVQNTYAKLKTKYAKRMITDWVEETDPMKHVFEDLSIAAFLIELWNEMYSGKEFPGFVDIGCGNGLLVHILIEEGYTGWGFDARRRKSWSIFTPKTQENLKELVLIPAMLQEGSDMASANQDMDHSKEDEPKAAIHNGVFPKGTFIISNHADELTPWTPILATLSQCPYISIPCCSHNLTGSRFRAPPPKEKGASNSAYSSLVSWVSKLASDCGWKVEKEMLRIPSTRNAALIGREREVDFADTDLHQILLDYGGGGGWEENAMKLVKTAPRGH